MRTVLSKAIFGVLFLMLAWKGVDGLIINFFYSKTETFDIHELEKMKTLETKNLVLKNGVSYNDDFIYHESENFGFVEIIYPLVSQKQKEKYLNFEPITVKLLVKIDHVDKNCLKSRDCFPKDASTVSGLAKSGLENLDASELKPLETSLVKIDENAIILELGDKPVTWYWNLLMFIIGAFFGIIILKSFFRKASSIKEYWQKITEKEEKV